MPNLSSMAAIDITPEEADDIFSRLERWHGAVEATPAPVLPTAAPLVVVAPAPAPAAVVAPAQVEIEVELEVRVEAPIGARTQLRRFVRSLLAS